MYPCGTFIGWFDHLQIEWVFPVVSFGKDGFDFFKSFRVIFYLNQLEVISFLRNGSFLDSDGVLYNACILSLSEVLCKPAYRETSAGNKVMQDVSRLD